MDGRVEPNAWSCRKVDDDVIVSSWIGRRRYTHSLSVKVDCDSD